MTSAGKKYRQCENVVTRSVAGETLLVPVCGKLADLQEIFSLTPVAAFIWEQLDGTRDVEAVAAKVTEQYEAGEEDVRSDCTEFVGRLLSAGLIEEA
jgi:hypothetical protein